MAEVRKVVTVVFADMAGSTALGEALDPETLRRVLQRHFAAARAAIERHGGTVEKFIGDAVMAVFGIPSLHEDDALRAVRAAWDLRAALAELNAELELERGFALGFRTGVNTGEVVAGDPAGGEFYATGDAVNVAARLEQAAESGEILLGEATYRLVHEAVRAEPVAPLSLKGKAEPVPAWRLLDVLPDVPAFTRPFRAPFVGRERELAKLEDAFTHAIDARSCQLVTVLGPPGIGKSRLARELVSAVGERARVLVGRCVPYGEGITYWPLAEIVEQVAGRDPAAIAELIADDEDAILITKRIAGAVGRGEAGGRSEEIAWAVRKLFEALARERPLIVVHDDIHWAQPTFLDLIEYLAGFTQGPVVLLALARSDLLEERASWSMPRPNASTILLEPLSERQAEALIEEVSDRTNVPESALRRIAEASEGNPLFLEQMIAFQAEEGAPDDAPVVPPTIQALLAARIDRLGPGGRAVIERASVEGRSFHRGAVSELLPEEARASLGGDLMSLVRKELIRPDRAAFAGDDGFRFVHALVQDAAYAAMVKELRADLHERFAAWLERAASERLVEYEEILGFHLEQAYRYRAELGPVDEHGLALASRAAELLAAAARRALNRGDVPAQANLLSRALALLSPRDPTRLELLVELGTSLTWMGDFERARVVLDEASDGSDARIAARARIERGQLRWRTEAGECSDLRREAERAIRILQASADDVGLARATSFLASLLHGQGKEVAAQEEWERSIVHARRAGSRQDVLEGLTELAWVAVWGPTSRVDALRRCQRVLAEVKGHAYEAHVLGALSCLRAFEGLFEEARFLDARGVEISSDLGLGLDEAKGSFSAGWVELLAGDAAAAEGVLRPGYERLAEFGATGALQATGSCLAQAIYMQGRFEESERLSLSIEQLDPTDGVVVALTRSVRAKTAARLGRSDEGERLAREAVALIDRTDYLVDRAEVRMGLAEVLLVAGRTDEAAQVLEEALRLHEEKGNLVSAERARGLLAELGR